MSEFRSDHLLVRDYVTAADHLQYAQLPEGVVAILLTHSNLPAKHLDIRLDLHLTISQVKDKFRTHIGTHSEHQKLILKNDGTMICEMKDDSKMLGFYSVCSGMEIHVVDTDPFSLSRGGGLTDTSLIQKYRMDDEVYDKKSGTMRDYIREQRKKDPNFKLKPKMGPGTEKYVQRAMRGEPASGNGEEGNVPPGVESVAGISIGMRCEATPGARRGVVRFVGEINEIKAGGYWVGIQLDEPLGSNDGSIKGNRIFECPDRYGAFVRGANIVVGNIEQFPERDLFASDDEEEEKEKGEEIGCVGNKEKKKHCDSKDGDGCDLNSSTAQQNSNPDNEEVDEF